MTDKLNGYEIAKELLDLQTGRVKRLENLMVALEDELKACNIKKETVDNRAKEILKDHKLDPDFLEAQYMAIIQMMNRL